MKKYTCLIVDDQKEAVNLIVNHVKKIDRLEVVLATIDPLEAISLIDRQRVDIIFSDIEMPEISGIDFIESLKERWGNDMPKIVFVTGYDNYALEGYEHGIVDYLMKPVSFTRLKKSVDRILNDLSKINEAEPVHNFFFADTNGKKVKITFDDILYIEAARNYIIIATGEKRHIIYRSMNSVLEVLPQDRFIRVHKSYILAIDRIISFRGSEFLIERKNKPIDIPVGITYKKAVLKRLNIS